MQCAPALAMAMTVAFGVTCAACGPRPRRDPALAAQAGSASHGGERGDRAPAPPPRSGADSASPAGRDAPTQTTRDWRAAYRDRTPIRVLEGEASYYHDSLAGRPTASGAPYDPRAFTAASRDLPFGTVVRVVRLDTGASVVVRVNDRGPFGRRRRILDLSRAAAEALDMIRRGVVPVRAEILELGGSRR